MTTPRTPILASQTVSSMHSRLNYPPIPLLGELFEAPEKKAQGRAKAIVSFVCLSLLLKQSIILGKWEVTPVIEKGIQQCPFVDCQGHILKDRFQIKNLENQEELSVDTRVLHVFHKRHQFPAEESQMSPEFLELKQDYDAFVASTSRLMGE